MASHTRQFPASVKVVPGVGGGDLLSISRLLLARIGRTVQCRHDALSADPGDEAIDVLVARRRFWFIMKLAKRELAALERLARVRRDAGDRGDITSRRAR